MDGVQKKYKLRIKGIELCARDYFAPMRKTLRKHGQYVLLHQIEITLLKTKTLNEAKEILMQYFVFVKKEK